MRRFSRDHGAHLFVAQEARKTARAGDFDYAMSDGRERFTSAADVNTSMPGAPADRPPGAHAGFPPLSPAAHPGTLTPFQKAVTACCLGLGLPAPVVEHRFHPDRLWRFDFAWPAERVYLEVEGGLWTNGRHSRGAGAIADLEKYSEAAILGWRGVYCTPSDVKRNGLDRVRRALRGS